MKLGGDAASPRAERARTLYVAIMEIAHELDTVDRLGLLACFKQERTWDQAPAAVRKLFVQAIERL